MYQVKTIKGCPFGQCLSPNKYKAKKSGYFAVGALDPKNRWTSVKPNTHGCSVGVLGPVNKVTSVWANTYGYLVADISDPINRRTFVKPNTHGWQCW